MATAVEVHARLRAQGFTLRVRDGRLIVAPASRLTEQDHADIRDRRDELVTAIDSVPSGCIAPLICGYGPGICGWTACLVDGEHDRFADAVTAARSPDNVHRVPDECMNDISTGDPSRDRPKEVA